MHTATHRIGLALSGGGFRASLYHLCLVRFFRDAGHLSRVTHIPMPQGQEYASFHAIRFEKGKRYKVERVMIVTEYLATDYTILAFKLLSLDADYDYEVVWTYK